MVCITIIACTAVFNLFVIVKHNDRRVYNSKDAMTEITEKKRPKFFPCLNRGKDSNPSIKGTFYRVEHKIIPAFYDYNMRPVVAQNALVIASFSIHFTREKISSNEFDKVPV